MKAGLQNGRNPGKGAKKKVPSPVGPARNVAIRNLLGLFPQPLQFVAPVKILSRPRASRIPLNSSIHSPKTSHQFADNLCPQAHNKTNSISRSRGAGNLRPFRFSLILQTPGGAPSKPPFKFSPDNITARGLGGTSNPASPKSFEI
jgi:hypothetical protein